MRQCDDILDKQEIARWPAVGTGRALPRALARQGLMSASQTAGRNWPVGCVSLEITQRCNLDCSLCYLSDLAEAVHDLPLVEIERRIAAIRDLYGPGTNVQISGGDPTLRRRDELIRIVRRVAEAELHPALLTNGIRADRSLLRELAAAGLKDVAFHVDLTQERAGYDSEAALNTVREAYLARANGLGLRVMFNTTVFAGNMAEMPTLCRFFTRHADEIQLVSFQMQADTGRGVLRRRPEAVSPQRMMAAIRAATGSALDFDTPLLGHPDCNRYSAVWVAGGRCHPVFDAPVLFARAFAAGSRVQGLWRRRQIATASLATLAVAPDLLARLAAYAALKLWRMRRDLLRSRGRVHKLSFLIHNFMDAERLERDRCESCIFMAAGRDGPVSMCVFNARRDREITQPLKLDRDNWDPLTGATPCGPAPRPPDPRSLPLKRLKGRMRAAADAGRAATRPGRRRAARR